MVRGDDNKYMKRALELASMAGGSTRPNPLVGAVIVHNGRIIGEGYHTKAGRAHAEVVAVNSVKNPELLGESTIYITLEPCSHTGRTPPCADMIAQLGIPRVVIGTTDTSKKVSGKGIKIISDAGCDVITGILEEECRELNKRFFTFHEKKRPYIILKWAQSNDGFIDRRVSPEHGSGSYRITGWQERLALHKWRTMEHSIMIGAETARIDDPQLTARYISGHDPVRVIVSDSGKLDNGLKIFTDGGKTIVYTNNKYHSLSGRDCVICGNGDITGTIMQDLYSREIQSVMVEGGTKLLRLFIDKGLWDETRIFTGREMYGEGIPAPLFASGLLVNETSYPESVLRVYRNYP